MQQEKLPQRKPLAIEKTINAATSTGNNRGYTINQRIRVAGIAQSKALVTIMGNRERGRLRAQIVRMREKRVIRHKASLKQRSSLFLTLMSMTHNKLSM